MNHALELFHSLEGCQYIVTEEQGVYVLVFTGYAIQLTHELLHQRYLSLTEELGIGLYALRELYNKPNIYITLVECDKFDIYFFITKKILKFKL